MGRLGLIFSPRGGKRQNRETTTWRHDNFGFFCSSLFVGFPRYLCDVVSHKNRCVALEQSVRALLKRSKNSERAGLFLTGSRGRKDQSLSMLLERF